MKECDKENKHRSSKLHMIYIYLLIMKDTLLLRPSLLFTTLHYTSVEQRNLPNFIKLNRFTQYTNYSCKSTIVYLSDMFRPCSTIIRLAKDGVN